MANFLEIPLLNSLTFREYSPTGAQNFHDKVEYLENYPNTKQIPLFQSFDIGDNILIQVSTNNTIKNVILINVETEDTTDLTGAVVNYSSAWSTVKQITTTDYGVVSFYDKTIYTSLLSGFYQIKLEFDNESDYKLSEIFRVHNCDENYPLITWYHSSTGLRKGIYFDGTQQFKTRINGRLLTYEPGIDIVLNEGYNSSVESLETNANFYAILDLGGLPRHFAEKLNVILQVDTKLINGVQYEIETGIELENNKNTNIYTGSIKLRQVNYEIYEDIESEEEEETYYLLADDFTDEGDEEILSIDGTDNFLIE